MANEIFLNNNEKFHVFSKSPITPSMGLAQAVNKSGHTTTTTDVWSQDIPWFFSADSQAIALSTGKDAKLNDLVLIGSNVFKRNATTYSDTATFADLWESLTLGNGTKLYNSDNKHVLTYHKGVPVTFLTTNNNAKQASNYAGRVFKSDDSVIEQFVASTDKVSSGVPSTGYSVAVYKSGSPLSEGELESNFIANSYAGIIQFNTKVGPSTAYTADVFEYVGEKLNTTVAELKIAADLVNEVDAKLTPITEIISDVRSTADEAKETAGAAVQSITDLRTSTISATSTGSDNVSVILSGTVSDPTLTVTGTDIASAQTLNAVKNTADSAVQTVTGDTYVTATKTDTGVTLSTQISEIDAALADENSEVGAAIKAAASASTTLGSTTIFSNDTDTGIKVELGGTVAAPTVDVTVTAATLNTDNKSFTTETSSNFAKASDVVTVATTIAAEKVASIETTETAEIAANAESTSTKLATEASVAKTAQTLTTAIDTIAGVGVSYHVLGDNETHESVTEPVKGRIYLEKDETAADGTYIEWFYTGTDWEKIGSTKADHSVYAKTITINGIAKTVSNNAVDLGKAVTSVTAGNGITSGTVSESGALSLILDEADTNKKGIVLLASTHEAADTTKAATGATVAAAISGIAEDDASDKGVKVITEGGSVTSVEVTTTSLVNDDDTLVEEVTGDNLITAADALAAIKLAKPEKYVASISGYNAAAESITSTQGAAIKVLDSRGEDVYPNDLWGTKATFDGITLTIDHNWVTNPNISEGSPWLDNVKAVQDNKAYSEIAIDADGKFTSVVEGSVLANIQTEMIKDGSRMFSSTSLTSFNGDLSNLVNGSSMFHSTTLESFSGDLNRLVNGSSMFHSTTLESFSGDLSNLIDGSSMFYSTTLGSFSGDLSNLANGTQMFENCKLSVDSVMYIADGIKDWGVRDSEGNLTGTTDGATHSITIHVDSTLTSDTEVAEYLTEIANKGWTVATNHSAFAVATAAANGTQNVIFVIARPVENEEMATHTTVDGKFVAIESAVSVIGIHQNQWSTFLTVEDAITEWELTPIVK